MSPCSHGGTSGLLIVMQIDFAPRDPLNRGGIDNRVHPNLSLTNSKNEPRPSASQPSAAEEKSHMLTRIALDGATFLHHQTASPPF